MKHLIIGIGEVGSAVATVLSGYDVSLLDKGESVSKTFDVLHICFPYSKLFVKDVKAYQRQYSPKCTIIYSSVPIGTTKKIPNAVHSPVEGKHPKLDYSIRKFERWIGYDDRSIAEMAEKIWEPITECCLVSDTRFTEFLKLASTSKYGINIVWAQYMADIARKLGMDYELVKQWDRDYNQLYKRINPEYQKFVLNPPNNKIGGHCVIPNAKLLNKQYPNVMLNKIEEMQ